MALTAFNDFQRAGGRPRSATRGSSPGSARDKRMIVESIAKLALRRPPRT